MLQFLVLAAPNIIGAEISFSTKVPLKVQASVIRNRPL